jgi:hypothetical protein
MKGPNSYPSLSPYHAENSRSTLRLSAFLQSTPQKVKSRWTATAILHALVFTSITSLDSWPFAGAIRSATSPPPPEGKYGGRIRLRALIWNSQNSSYQIPFTPSPNSTRAEYNASYTHVFREVWMAVYFGEIPAP